MEHQDVQIQSIIQNLVAVNQNVESATTNISKVSSVSGWACNKFNGFLQARQSTSLRRVLAYVMFGLGFLLLLYHLIY